MDKTGIIIPTYDSLDTLKTLIINILDYTDGDYQIYVVEDGQKEETIEWLKGQEKVKTIYHEVNKGIAPSWNDGLRAAHADGCSYFAIFNDDIELPPKWQEECRKAFEDKKVHLIGLDAECPIPLTGWFFILDKICLERVGYFDEQFKNFCSEDDDYFIRYQKTGMRFVRISTKVFHWGSKTINKLRAVDLKKVNSIREENWRKLHRKHPAIRRQQYA